MEVGSYISLDEAIRKGLRYKPKIAVRTMKITDAVGKYSIEDVKSPMDFPEYDRSAVDGYAVKSRETISASKTNPATFTLAGSLFPSSTRIKEVKDGDALKVTTGTKIPGGADAVVMLEDAAEERGVLKVFSPVRKLQNISLKGEDLKRNTSILSKGHVVTPPHLVALLQCGIREVKVCAASLGIVSTGDELVSGRVINSTQPFLQSLFERKGFRVKGYGAVGDDEVKIQKYLERVKEDIIIATGGTGPGEKDLLPIVIKKNGKLVFRGLRIRPGRTTAFGIFKGKPVFVISGLPVAALMASENVILKLLYKWFDLIPPGKEYGRGILQRSVVNTLGFKSFVRVRLEEEAGKVKVIPTRTTGSGVVSSVINADGILEIDENSEGLGEGESVTFEVLRW